MRSIIIIYLIVVIFIVLIVTLLILILLQQKQLKLCKRIGRLQQEGIVCKDLILEEYARARHEYNNLLQTLMNLIEEEDMTALKEYLPKLHVKAQSLHSNNILQLEKLNDLSLLNVIYQLYLDAVKLEILFNISISGKIKKSYQNVDELHPLLVECLHTASHLRADSNLTINMGLR